jgi:hypothetical protein
MLMADLNSWPHISTRKMFGFLFFYRKRVVFAALPLTRGFNSPSSLILKFGAMPAKLLKRAQADERMHASTRRPAHGWHSFQVHSEADLRDALSLLNQAHEAAGR